MESIFDTAREICKSIKLSPERDSELDESQRDANNVSKNIHALCPTVWIVRGEELQRASIFNQRCTFGFGEIA